MRKSMHFYIFKHRSSILRHYFVLEEPIRYASSRQPTRRQHINQRVVLTTKTHQNSTQDYYPIMKQATTWLHNNSSLVPMTMMMRISQRHTSCHPFSASRGVLEIPSYKYFSALAVRWSTGGGSPEGSSSSWKKLFEPASLITVATDSRSSSNSSGGILPPGAIHRTTKQDLLRDQEQQSAKTTSISKGLAVN